MKRKTDSPSSGTAGEKSRRLRISDFLRIVPDREKMIGESSSEDPKPSGSYRANALAAVLHPGVQYLKVAERRDLSDTVSVFTLVPDTERGTAKLAPFGAGSCISVRIRKDGCTYRRPYSICSSPGDALPSREGGRFTSGTYRIAVKREKSGTVSEHIHAEWEPGTPVEASEPFGELLYEPLRDAKDVICIAGGIGITPFISMIKAITEGTEDFRLTLLYGIRTENDILFRDELEAASADGRIKTVFVLSDSETPGFEHGLVGAGIIRKYAPADGRNYSVFACGPRAMYGHLEKELKSLGIRRKFMRFEVSGELHDPDAEEDYTAPDSDGFTIKVVSGGQTRSIRCGSKETLLHAMERSGIDAPSRCRSGECGFCHSRLISGEYYTPSRNDRRREADRKYGYLHPCCTFPLSDMEIDVPPPGGRC